MFAYVMPQKNHFWTLGCRIPQIPPISCRLAVICTASPCATDTEHTISTLRLGATLAGFADTEEKEGWFGGPGTRGLQDHWDDMMANLLVSVDQKISSSSWSATGSKICSTGNHTYGTKDSDHHPIEFAGALVVLHCSTPFCFSVFPMPHTYIHAYIHTYIHPCIHTSMHARTHTCMHTYILQCRSMCTHKYKHTYIYIYT